MIPAATVPMLLRIYMLNDLNLEMPSVQAQDFFQQQHKRGQMELQRNISEQCWRTCPQRINKIYFQHGMAGLGDRLTVIDNLAQIAGYLCAILEVPPPSKMLALKHNNGNRVSENVKWLDFRNLTFLQDDSQAVRGLDASFSEDFDASPVYKEENFPGWLHIVSGKSDSKGLLEDFIRLQEFYTHHFNLMHTQALLLEALKERVRMNGLTNSIYGFLHIRRGDAIAECDTRIEVIDYFLKCSLNGTETQGKNITLLLGSDETNTTYREKVMKLQDGFPHVSILDADSLTLEVIKEAATSGLIDASAGFENNNFYNYEVQRTLKRDSIDKFSSVFLDKRRKNCNKCTRLVDHFPSVWKKERDRRRETRHT